MNCREVTSISALYLSGELDPPRTAAMRKHLDSCDACARELEQVADLDARVRDAVWNEPLETESLDERVRSSIAATSRAWMRAALGVAAAALIALLVYRGLFLPDPTCAAAAQDHRREVVEGSPRNWISDPAAIAALAAREGIDTSAISKLGGHLERAKLCRIDGRAFLHLVYSENVSVFLRADSSGARAVRELTAGAEHVASFGTGRLSAMIVGSRPSVKQLLNNFLT